MDKCCLSSSRRLPGIRPKTKSWSANPQRRHASRTFFESVDILENYPNAGTIVQEFKEETFRQIIKGNYIISILDKMIALADTNIKDLEKQIKKTQSDEEVKMVLGL